MKRLLAAFIAVFCMLFLSACGDSPSAASSSPAGFSSGAGSAEPLPQTEPAPLTDEERAAELVSSMTTEEKVGQLFFVRCPADSAAEDVSRYHLGGYLLFGRDITGKTADELIQTIAAYQTAAGDIPLLIGVDEEGGTVARVSSNPNLRPEKYRSAQQLYKAGGMDAVLADAQDKDRLLESLGFNVNLAPVADVSMDSGDFIYARSFGKDARDTASYVGAVVTQMRSDGMGSVLKHFPGYGNNADTHTGIAVDKRSLESFRTSDFLPFRAGIDAGGDTTAVLVSHNIMDAVDSSLPASLSPGVHALLRRELGFDGVVMTDDLAMDAVAAYSADGAVAVLALMAGNDLLLTTDYRTQIPKVLAAVADGTLDEAVIDAACTRVLVWKLALGLL